MRHVLAVGAIAIAIVIVVEAGRDNPKSRADLPVTGDDVFIFAGGEPLFELDRGGPSGDRLPG